MRCYCGRALDGRPGSLQRCSAGVEQAEKGAVVVVVDEAGAVREEVCLKAP